MAGDGDREMVLANFQVDLLLLMRLCFKAILFSFVIFFRV